jgi:GNAT superfamily N-acetyltransferase
MMPMTTIRSAKVDDCGTILGFIRALAEYEKLTHACVATEELIRDNLFGPRPAAEVLIAWVNEQPVGFALFFTTFSTFLGKPGIWLEDLFVLPNSRGAGVGKQLLKRVAGLAVERGYGRLEWSVLDWNEPSIGFYKSMGAVAMDEWTTYRLTGDALRVAAEVSK